MNAHIESFHKLLEEERLATEEFMAYANAYGAVDEYMRRYNQHRIHSSLHYLAPAEFHKRHLATGLQPKKTVKV